MKPLSQTLSSLVVLTEELLARPLLDPRSVAGRFAAIAADVRAAEARPAEGIRTTSAALVTVTAIEEYRHAASDRASMWLMLIGATLPLLRAAAFDALNEERQRRDA